MTGFMKGLYTEAEMKSDNVKVGLRGAVMNALFFPLALMIFFFYKLCTLVCVIYMLIMVG